MDPASNVDVDGVVERSIELPSTLANGATILVVGPFDPSEHALSLRIVGEYGTADDTALVVTTRASAEETIDTWEEVAPAGARPAIGIVDTTSEEPTVTSTFGDVPTIFTPSSGDVERIVMALSELSGVAPPRQGSRHLVFRSLTPILEEAATEQVCRVLERVGGLRTGHGLGLFGVDVSAHDRETLTALADTVDGVIWIDRTSDGGFESEFHAKRGHVPF